MIRKLYTLLLIGLCLNLVACSDDNDNIDPNAAAPVVKFPMEQLDIDLNLVDNLPVVAVIKSQAGLQQVDMKIQTAEGIIDYKTVTEFFNPNSYSLSEQIEYGSNYQSFIIEAIDKLNNQVVGTLPFAITDVKERPVITFNPEEIVYDEMDENPVIPRTTFQINSEAGLKQVEMFLVTINGQENKGTAILNGEHEYSFDDMINYKEGDKGFKVKAEDAYGNVTISTLPVTYRTVPGPVLTLNDQVVFAETGVKSGVSMHVESVKGLQEIVIYRIENGKEVEAYREKMHGEKILDYAPKFDFTAATTQVKVVVSDGRQDKTAESLVKAYVNMDVATLYVGSQQLANTAHDKYPDAFGLVSLKDLKTYSIDYALSSPENAKNVDFKLYCFGGQAVPRLYSMDDTEKDGEYKASSGNLKNIQARNMTRFTTLPNFDYENATTESISKISSDLIKISKLTPIKAGDIVAFRTGGSSAAGGDRIGVMKIVDITGPKEVNPGITNACVMTVEIKFPKKK